MEYNPKSKPRKKYGGTVGFHISQGHTYLSMSDPQQKAAKEFLKGQLDLYCNQGTAIPTKVSDTETIILERGKALFKAMSVSPKAKELLASDPELMGALKAWLTKV
jgi:hypothetical protein